MRDDIVEFISKIVQKTEINKQELLGVIGIGKSRYYNWVERIGKPNNHNGKIPKSHWVTPEEIEKILSYCKDKIEQGYRRLTYIMIDEDIVAVSPSTTYRILKEAGLMNRWQRRKSLKGNGFKQPLKPHEHWHIDISYINVLGTMFFLISILDGASRYIINHELRANMQEYDVELVLERAKEKYPNAKPRIISDNGGQFMSREFKEYIRISGFTHVRTSVAYPQSNGKLERYHRTIKEEEIRRNSYVDIEQARREIAEYVNYYNTKRLHSAIYYLTPEDVLLGRTQTRIQEREAKLDKARQERIEAYKKGEVA